MHRLSGFMRTYWTRGEPGRATPRSLAVFMQRMWLAAWSLVTLLAARSIGLSTRRPPTPTLEYEPEPQRDAHGGLNRWAAADSVPCTH